MQLPIEMIMNVGLHPAHKHDFHGRAETAEVKRPDGPKEHGCLGGKRGCGSGVKLEAVTQALAQAVVVKLRQSLSVSVSAAPKPAGLTPTEQARGEIASALGTALHTPAEDGSLPPASDVRALAESAIQDSAKELQQVGASTNAVTDAVDALTAHLGSLFDAFSSKPGFEDKSVVAAATSARLVTKEKGVLELRTREGDVVRISFRNRVDVKAQGTVATDGVGSYTALDVTARVRSGSEISVKGDLNAEELAAIADMVGKVDELANEFFAGNVDEAFAAAAALDLDDGPLADLSLRLSMSQRYSEANVVAQQPLPVPEPASPPSDTTGANPLPPAAEASPPATETSTPPADATTEQLPSAPVTAGSDTLANDPSETPSDKPSAAQSIQLVVAKFMARSWVSFQGDDTAKLGVSMKMKFQLLTAAIEAARPAAADANDGCLAKLADVSNAVIQKDAAA